MSSMQTHLLRSCLTAAALLAAGSARADLVIDASLSFDDVLGGSTANSVLTGVLASQMRFANPDRVNDVDAFGVETGTFHWEDFTSLYGEVRVQSSANALSGPNVLDNDGQPILIVFSAPIDVYRFAIQQDASGFGNLQANGSQLAFLDAEGHELTGGTFSYTQGAHPGLEITNGSTVVQGVSAILLAGGSDYDNLSLTTVSAIPEPGTLPLLLGGLGVLAWWGRCGRRETP